MDLRTVDIHAPVQVRSCHLRFAGETGPDQFGRREHLLEIVSPKPKANGRPVEFSPKNVYRLEGETTFKAGETIDTDFVFPKGMREKASYADESEAEASEPDEEQSGGDNSGDSDQSADDSPPA